MGGGVWEIIMHVATWLRRLIQLNDSLDAHAGCPCEPTGSTWGHVPFHSARPPHVVRGYTVPTYWSRAQRTQVGMRRDAVTFVYVGRYGSLCWFKMWVGEEPRTQHQGNKPTFPVPHLLSVAIAKAEAYFRKTGKLSANRKARQSRRQETALRHSPWKVPWEP